MVQLQQPQWVYMGGKLCPWEDAVLHISTEAVTRGLNVFEGLKGYWRHDGESFGIVALKRHFERLERSARLLHIPCPVDFDEFEGACHELVRALWRKDRDMWVRATLYVVEGHWGEGTRADLVLTAYQESMSPPEPIAVGVSTWRRSSDVTLPPRVKTSTNYQVARLARIEGRGRGFHEMILLNQSGRVAEATGACVLMVRDGQVISPPPSEGRLESITVSIAAELCRSLGISFVERPIDRTELYIADEICLAGTLAELVKVRRIDEYELPDESPILSAIAHRYATAVREKDPHPAIELSRVYTTLTRRNEFDHRTAVPADRSSS
jgi:branched-chain amino acid aminotransferase